LQIDYKESSNVLADNGVGDGEAKSVTRELGEDMIEIKKLNEHVHSCKKV